MSSFLAVLDAPWHVGIAFRVDGKGFRRVDDNLAVGLGAIVIVIVLVIVFGFVKVFKRYNFGYHFVCVHF